MTLYEDNRIENKRTERTVVPSDSWSFAWNEK